MRKVPYPNTRALKPLTLVRHSCFCIAPLGKYADLSLKFKPEALNHEAPRYKERGGCWEAFPEKMCFDTQKNGPKGNPQAERHPTIQRTPFELHQLPTSCLLSSYNFWVALQDPLSLSLYIYIYIYIYIYLYLFFYLCMYLSLYLYLYLYVYLFL